MPSRNYKTINRTLGKAHHRYGMLADGDRLCVGLSGGKDSLTLMWFLHERLPRIPIDYTIVACHVDPGFENGCAEKLEQFCEHRGWSIRVEHTDHGVVAHSPENLENPCFLCARRRRQRLFEVAAELNCNKLALGHTKDDIIESLFLNMFYAGEISVMMPYLPMFGGEITIIRPLAFTDENDIKRFAAEKGFPEFINPCPSADRSKRWEIKNMLETLYKSNRKIKGNIFRALGNVKRDYLL
ncbi:MAG: ATP-binding protein [Thermodesulfobacteriota bacterium]|nr:ATP-binding protein [Thermodesulfobacteriota bacterium]